MARVVSSLSDFINPLLVPLVRYYPYGKFGFRLG